MTGKPAGSDLVSRKKSLVEQSGGRAWAQAEADRQAEAARRALAEAGPDPAAAVDLEVLTALLARRDR